MNRLLKTILLIIPVLLATLSGCGENKQATDDFITVDVTKKYSAKKEVILQDFMNVEYIPLETNDEFINQGFVQDIGKDFIIVRNRNDDGDIFVYDRAGKAIRKINHKGQSGEEYLHIFNIILDEDNNEMFVNDAVIRKISVYDLYGNFKRSFNHKKNTYYFQRDSLPSTYTNIFNYDQDHLICYHEYNGDIAFVLISKQDGSITKEIKIPFEKKQLLLHFLKKGDMVYSVGPSLFRTIIPYDGNWILLELSSDTVYTLLPDNSLRPFLIRNPPIRSMDPGVFLIFRLMSDRYIFMETIKNVYDWDTKSGFPRTFFMYDRQERAFSGYTVYNGDYSTKKEIYMSETRPVNHEIESWYPLEAHQLVEAYEKGELKGKLKEIAATLNEESNPVIMLIKHKK